MNNSTPSKRSHLYRIYFVVIFMISSFSVFADYDYILKNGIIHNGLGDKAVVRDLAIEGGKIVKIGRITQPAKKIIDVSGKIVSPGWIDMMDQSGEVLLKNGLAENKVLMGVTTAFGGEGGTPVKAGEILNYFHTLERQGISINFGTYYNVFQARNEVLGEKNIKATDTDISQMKKYVDLAMKEGVVGISSAAFYPPASFMTTKELIELAKVTALYNGIYAAHMRDESRLLLAAIDEMITVAKESGVRTEIYHFKNAYAPHWDTEIHKAIKKIQDARNRKIDIAANQYPYIAGGTGLDATVPTWVFADGETAAFEKMRDPDIRARAREDINSDNSDRMVAASGGWKNVVLANSQNEEYKKFEGKNFIEIGELLNKTPSDAAWDIMLAAYPKRAYALFFYANEQDLKTILKQPWVSIGSDAAAAEKLGYVDALGLPHPRSYGTFPRIISKYVRDEGLLSLEEGIRKMTSLPAKRMKHCSCCLLKAYKLIMLFSLVFLYLNYENQLLVS